MSQNAQETRKLEFFQLFFTLGNRGTFTSHQCLDLPLFQSALYKWKLKVFADSWDKMFCTSWDPSSFHTSSLLLSHHAPSSSLVGGTGDTISSLWRKISTEVSWNLAKHSALCSRAHLPLMEIKCLNLCVFPSFSVLLCALGWNFVVLHLFLLAKTFFMALI